MVHAVVASAFSWADRAPVEVTLLEQLRRDAGPGRAAGQPPPTTGGSGSAPLLCTALDRQSPSGDTFQVRALSAYRPVAGTFRYAEPFHRR